MSLPTAITPTHIESVIHDKRFVRLKHDLTPDGPDVTICHLMLKNGKNVVGINYGAIDPSLHSVERGEQEAYRNALDKLYELEGYNLITEHYRSGTGLLIKDRSDG